MNRKRIVLTAFVLAALAQLAVPLSMITARERALREGQLFRFRTAPVDPYDAFRGRYVALRIEPESVPVASNTTLRTGQAVYAVIREGTNGFAEVAELRQAKPDSGRYIRVKARHVYGNQAHLEYPFDRYYMNEKLAPAAEDAYRKHSRRGSQDTYVAVRVRGDLAVLEELYVGGKPILEFIATQESR